MGFNTWNRFLDSRGFPRIEELTEDSVLELARAQVDSGMLAAGYEYFVLDDGYQAFSRDSQGRLQGHPRRFRSGIAALVKEVKALGLKMGMYAVPGRYTCLDQYFDYHGFGNGSLGFEEIDAITFAEWGVDYLKYDWCRAHLNDGLEAPTSFEKMANALNEHAPHIVYSISEYGLFKPHTWAPEFANLWRTTDDLFASWKSILATIDLQIGLDSYSRPGAWNDPDMLQIGNHGLTFSENRAHMIMWAVLNAPLMAGNDLASMTDEVRTILCHKGLIAVNQDWGGRQGKLSRFEGDLQVWTKPMSDGSIAIAYLNRGDQILHVQVSDDEPNASLITDVWSGAGISAASRIEVEPHGAVLVLSS
jgi:alpha-galactosidase